MLADLQSVETMLDRAKRTARTGDKDAEARVEILEECNALLAAGKPVRRLVYDDRGAAKALAELQLMTTKPVLYVANVDEDDLDGKSPHVTKLRSARCGRRGARVVPVCARARSGDRRTRRSRTAGDARKHGPHRAGPRGARPRRLQLLGLQSYFTAGEKEVRAWTIPVGATAPQAAGVIHTDFERGFIRCEMYSVDDLEQYKSEKAIREAGKLRVEGKNYVMQDSDVCHFLFNV